MKLEKTLLTTVKALEEANTATAVFALAVSLLQPTGASPHGFRSLALRGARPLYWALALLTALRALRRLLAPPPPLWPLPAHLRCAVCYVKPPRQSRSRRRVLVAFPCGHCCCWVCAVKVVDSSKRCPFCRAPVEAIDNLLPLNHFTTI